MNPSFDLEKFARGDYEAERLNRTKTSCYDATSPNFSVLSHQSPFYRPLADEARLQNGMQRPTWPDGKRFAVCLTHDVDVVSLNATSHHTRRFVRALRYTIREPNIRNLKVLASNGWLIGKTARANGKNDPAHCYEKWLQMEAEVGATSTFLFLPEKTHYPHATDGGYRFNDMVMFEGRRVTVREMMKEIASRGWEVGLHALWNSWRNLDEMRYQKEQIENAAECEVVSLRQHCLHFDIRKSPQIYARTGILFDTSIGFNDNVGFRFGTCYPWLLRKPSDDVPQFSLELPLVIQDKALMGCCLMDREIAMTLVRRLIDEVERVGGVLTLLWHASFIAQDRYVSLYADTLKLVKERNAYIGSMREIGKYWLDNYTNLI